MTPSPQPVFADTSYWYGLMIRTDQWHAEAVRAGAAARDRTIVTTEMVLAELLNAVSRLGPDFRADAVAKIQEMRRDPQITIIEQTAAQFDAALAYYADRLDKRWGITDCASFLAMTDAGITDALTADRDFGQAGFRVLMRNVVSPIDKLYPLT